MSNFWNRGKDNVTDAQDYLRSTDHVSRPMALLLSLFGFLLVFAVVFSLFLAGRWLWQRLSDSGADNSSTTSQVTPTSSNTVATNVVVADDSTADSDDVSADSSSDSASSEDSTTASSTSSENADSTSSATTLPRTGPTENLLTLVAITTIAGVAHNVYARSRS